MKWWPILKDCRDFMRTDVELVGTELAPTDLLPANINAGAGATEDIFPSVKVLRDSDDNLARRNMLKTGTTLFYVEQWIRNDDPDPSVAYGLISQMEQRVEASLQRWFKVASQRLGMACKFEIKTLLGDNDVFRPVVGSRFIIIVTWNSNN